MSLKRKKPLRARTPIRNKALKASAQRDGHFDAIRTRKPRAPKRAFTRARKQPKATPEEQAHLNAVAALKCDACTQDNAQQASRTCLHHMREGYGGSQRASHWEVLPECEGHHQGILDTSRPVAFHRAPRTFQVRYGSEPAALKRTWERLGLDFETLPAVIGKEPPWWRDYLRGAFEDVIPEETRATLTYTEEEQ